MKLGPLVVLLAFSTSTPAGAQSTGRVRIVDIDQIDGAGAIDVERARQVVHSRLGDFRFHCFDPEFRLDPMLAGHVRLQATIGGDGLATEIRLVESTFTTAVVPNCTVERVRHLPFPAPTGGAAVLELELAFDHAH